MKIAWRTEWPLWLLMAGMFLLAAFGWSTSPERIPVHWGIGGQVDRYGGKFEGLLGIPLLTVALYGALLLLPYIDPGRANYAAFARAYFVFRLALVSFLAAIYGVAHLWIRGITVDVASTVPFLVGALFILIGNLLGKIRPNWFIGIRTPWTLSSKLSWDRTHRVGGWLFIAVGLVFMVAGVLHAAWSLWLVVGMLLASVAFLVVFSYSVWRVDPDKTPPAGTLPAP